MKFTAYSSASRYNSSRYHRETILDERENDLKKDKERKGEREGKNSESAGSCIFYPRPAHLFPFLFLLFVLLCYNGNSIRGPGGSEGFVSNSIEAAANVQSSGGIRETAEIAASLRARAAQISYENSNV